MLWVDWNRCGDQRLRQGAAPGKSALPIGGMQAEQPRPPRPPAPGEPRPAPYGRPLRPESHPAQALAASYSAGLIVTAASWDVAGTCALLPPWWPPVSHVLIGLGVGAGCLAVLLRLLLLPRTASSRHPTLLELGALGLLLGAWLLRGDAEVVPDPPLVGTQVVALALLAAAAWLRRRTAAAVGATAPVPRAPAR
jgi:hypothetical protein